MHSSLKKIILAITLGIPVLTYIFLKTFGDNRYQLPVYYQEAEPLASCNSANFPHIVEIEQVNLASSEAHIFYFPGVITSEEVNRQLRRVINKFEGAVVHGLIKGPGANGFGTTHLIEDDSTFLEIINCELLMGEGEILMYPPSDKLVLVDKFGYIRGYYNGAEFDDIDRLEVEIEILFTEYNYDR